MRMFTGQKINIMNSDYKINLVVLLTCQKSCFEDMMDWIVPKTNPEQYCIVIFLDN